MNWIHRNRKPFKTLPPMGWERLVDYNTEVARGIRHTPEYDHEMTQLQLDFDAWAAEEFA